MKGLLVTGTDTGVGKTAVASALLRAAALAGLRVGAMKPLESGCARGEDGQLRPDDALLLRGAAGSDAPQDVVCPYRFAAPLAPGIAAAREGVRVDWGLVEAQYARLRESHPDGVVVEGAGGLLVPLDAELTTVADLAERLGLPVLLVARDALGTINHTALTLEALAGRGLTCRGIVLNRTSESADLSTEDNAQVIERLTGTRVVARLPFAREQRVDALAAALARQADPAALLGVRPTTWPSGGA